MGLIHGKINPPLLPLVDLCQNQLAGDIGALVIRRRPLTAAYDGELLESIGVKIRLIRPQLTCLNSQESSEISSFLTRSSPMASISRRIISPVSHSALEPAVRYPSASLHLYCSIRFARWKE